MLNIKNLTKSFGDTDVLNSVSFSVNKGDILALVGPSGSGKTTLLRLLAGFEETDAGQITLSGRDITKLTPSERETFLLFQKPVLYPFLTVRENLTYPPEDDEWRNDSMLRRVASLVQIEKLLDRDPNQLSGGERQRVALGRCLMSKSSVYLFDEPLSDVDPLMASEIRDHISDFLSSYNSTAIYVTHNQVEASRIASKLAVINDGVIHQVDTPRGVYIRPSTTFVAQFIGSEKMSLFNATTRGDYLCVDELDVSFPIGDLDIPADCLQVNDINIGFRNLRLVEEPSSDADIHGAIDSIFYQYENSVVVFKSGTGMSIRIVTNISPTELSDSSFSLSLDSSILLLFDSDGDLIGSSDVMDG